jgi:enediyne biosynthesis protein E4
MHFPWIVGPLLVWLVLVSLGCTRQAELVWQEEAGYRWAELAVSGNKNSGFDRMPGSKTGITFVNILLDEEMAANQNLHNGSGVAVGDFDGDGYPDIYFAHLHGPNALYRNLGNWRFEDVTESAGVAAPDRFSTGAVFADVDGDGDLDLLVTALGGPNAAFRNDGNGRFTEVTDEWGLSSYRGSTTMALADVDGDGDLDLYVTNYKRITLRDTLPPDQISWDKVVRQTGPQSYEIDPEWKDHYTLEIKGTKLIRLESGEPDYLYINDGTGRFTRERLTDGRFLDEHGSPLTTEPRDWGLEVQFFDVNRDGWPDLYVCNDFESPDYFFLNDGTGRFQALPALALRKTANSTMSVDFGDINRDGQIDLFMADMLDVTYEARQIQMATGVPVTTEIGDIDGRPQAMENMLFINRGDDTFADITHWAGVPASGWSWSVNFIDVDLDGYPDILISTGNAIDIQNSDVQEADHRRRATVRSFDEFRRLILHFPPLYQRNVVFRNKGNLQFESVKDGWGFGDELDIAQGLAFGDFDNDGDLDVVVNRMNREAGLYRNRAGAGRVAVRLKGLAPNTEGIGAKVRLRGGSVEQEEEMQAGGLYNSGSQTQLMFAAEKDRDLELEVRWRSGRVSVITGVRANRIYEVDEPPTEPSFVPEVRPFEIAEPIYRPVPISHRHPEAPFDDFGLQPLLHRRLSQLGPAVAVADLDGDGFDDLVIGSGAGFPISLLKNDGQGRLLPLPGADGTAAPSGDHAGIVFLPRQGEPSLLIVGESNYEIPIDSSRIAIYEVTPSGLHLRERLNAGQGAIGPLALADLNGDGELDLFVGGRVRTLRYPEAAGSRVYLWEDGRFVDRPDLAAGFAGAGMVSGVTFGDINQDGHIDAVLAVEWGPVRLYLNDGSGRFTEETGNWGLHRHTGWWNGVTLGDFDGDGRLDVAATNWGWNSRYAQPDGTGDPLLLYHGDYDGDRVVEPVLARRHPEKATYVPDRGFGPMSVGLPYLRTRIPSFAQFASMTVEEILGREGRIGAVLQANVLGHTVFLNRGNRFESMPLPLEAQLVPAHAVAVADFDGDGIEDLFLGQNFFAVPIEIPRLDAGRGLWLRGKGDGTFDPVPGWESGVKVYGEARAVGLADFDGDGRVDIAVTQNGAATTYWRNERGEPGIRVRFAPGAASTSGIGSAVQLVYDDGSTGPLRPIGAGTGYWSQESLVPVLGIGSGRSVRAVRFTLPGRGHFDQAVVPGSSEVVVTGPPGR